MEPHQENANRKHCHNRAAAWPELTECTNTNHVPRCRLDLARIDRYEVLLRLWALNEQGYRERWALTHPEEPSLKIGSPEEKRAAVGPAKVKSGKPQCITPVPKDKPKKRKCVRCSRMDDDLGEHAASCKGQRSPLCGRGHIKVVSHIARCAEAPNCTKCGKRFLDVSQHSASCKGRVVGERKEECPGCGRMFSRLKVHKCHA